jgi:hypothetical protein
MAAVAPTDRSTRVISSNNNASLPARPTRQQIMSCDYRVLCKRIRNWMDYTLRPRLPPGFLVVS